MQQSNDDQPGKGVLVSYCDEFGIWPHLMEEFNSRLPMRNVEWKASALPAFIANASNYSNRSRSGDICIPELFLDLQKFSTDAPASRGVGEHNLRKFPYLHLYFVSCEDLDVYRAVIKKQIHEWVESISARRNQEWLIVYVSKEAPSANPRFLIRSTVYDRIRNDFNIGKRDRCVQLSLLTMKDDEMWQEIFTHIADGLFYAYGQVITQIYEDIRRTDAQRKLPGFNYCNFFLLKEGLAFMLESMGLFEEALVLYDELEASFIQCLDSNLQKDAIPWSENFGANDPMDDSASILSVNRKLYQKMIAQNSISLFDFRTYLFARQVHLLKCSIRPVELCLRAKWFMSALAISLVERELSLPPHFLQTWIYSAAMQIVEFCNENFDVADVAPARYFSVLAEIQYDARRQLDALGLLAGFLTEDPPHSMKLMPSTPRSLCKTSSSSLSEALSSSNKFVKHYVELSERIRHLNEIAQFDRKVQLLKLDLIRIMALEGKWELAKDRLIEVFSFDDFSKTSGNIAVNFDKPNKWTFIELHAACLYARCLRERGEMDSYLAICLMIIRHPGKLTQVEYEFYTEQTKSLSTSKTIKNFIVDLKSFVRTKLITETSSDVDIFSSHDGRRLVLRLCSYFPADLRLEKVSLTVFGPSNVETDFVAHEKDLILKRGHNDVVLSGKASIPAGRYFAGELKLLSGSLVLTTSFIRPGSPKIIIVVLDCSDSIRMEIDSVSDCNLHIKDVQQMDTDAMSDSHLLELSSPAEPSFTINIEIHSRNNEIAPRSNLELSSKSMLSFSQDIPVEAKVIFGDVTTHHRLSIVNSNIEIPLAINRNSILQLRIPVADSQWKNYIFAASLRDLSVADVEKDHDIRVDWKFAPDGSLTSHSLSASQRIKLIVPISCSYRPVFVGKKKLLEYSVKCGSKSGPFLANIEIDKQAEMVQIARPPIIFPHQHITGIADTSSFTNNLPFEIKIDYQSAEHIFEQSLLSIIAQMCQQLLTTIPEPHHKDIIAFITWLIIYIGIPSADIKNKVIHNFSIFRQVELIFPSRYRRGAVNNNQLYLSARSIGLPAPWWCINANRVVSKLYGNSHKYQSGNESNLKFIGGIVEIVKTFFASDQRMVSWPQVSESANKNMVITIDIPTYKYVLLTEFRLLKEPGINFEVGKPISTSIAVSLLNVENRALPPNCEMVVEIVDDPENWMIAGKRKLMVKLEGNLDIPTMLVPLKTGMLLLPQIVCALSIPDNEYMTRYPSAGQQILVHPALQTQSFWIPSRLLEPQEDIAEHPAIVRSRLATPMRSGGHSHGSQSVPIFTPAAAMSLANSGKGSKVVSPTRRGHTTSNSLSFMQAFESGTSFTSANEQPPQPQQQQQQQSTSRDNQKWNWLSPALLGDQVREKVLKQVGGGISTSAGNNSAGGTNGQWKRARKFLNMTTSPGSN
eukprot:Partr_v1_DN28717_c1_g1_i2_m62817 putative trafficking protein particle complex